MGYTDIFNQVSVGSVSVAATGSSFYTGRLSRTSVFVAVSTAQSGTATTDVTANIQTSYNDETWHTVDSKEYSSGTSTHLDTFSYNAFWPYMRTTITNVTAASGASVSTTTITGRGM